MELSKFRVPRGDSAGRQEENDMSQSLYDLRHVTTIIRKWLPKMGKLLQVPVLAY